MIFNGAESMKSVRKNAKSKDSITRTNYSTIRVLENLVKSSSTRVLDTRQWNH